MGTWESGTPATVQGKAVQGWKGRVSRIMPLAVFYAPLHTHHESILHCPGNTLALQV